MYLTNREKDKLTIAVAADVARKRKARATTLQRRRVSFFFPKSPRKAILNIYQTSFLKENFWVLIRRADSEIVFRNHIIRKLAVIPFVFRIAVCDFDKIAHGFHISAFACIIAAWRKSFHIGEI